MKRLKDSDEDVDAMRSHCDSEERDEVCEVVAQDSVSSVNRVLEIKNRTKLVKPNNTKI